MMMIMMMMVNNNINNSIKRAKLVALKSCSSCSVISVIALWIGLLLLLSFANHPVDGFTTTHPAKSSSTQWSPHLLRHSQQPVWQDLVRVSKGYGKIEKDLGPIFAKKSMKHMSASFLPMAIQDYPNDHQEHPPSDNNDNQRQQHLTHRTSTDPKPVLLSWLEESPLKPGTIIPTLAISLVLLLSSSPSWAAMSGGRMGGSFSSPSRSSSSSSSRSYYSAPSYSRGYSQGYSSGFGTGYYSRPSVTISPFYNPFFPPPQPYFYGGGPGVIAYSRGPSLLDLFLLGGLVFAITSFVRNRAIDNSTTTLGDQDDDDNRDGSFWSKWSSSSSSSSNTEMMSALGSGTSVLQLSVAIEVPNRDDPQSMLSVLNRLAKTAQTDSRVGISNLASQVALELLRRKSSMVSALSKYQHFQNRNKAQREYQSIAVKERGKFETETISQYGGVDYSSSSSSSSTSHNTLTTTTATTSTTATMAVVTLILALDGDSTKLSPIRSIVDVEDALRKIAADVKVDNCLQSCEILWTPTDRSETLTLRDVIADYPELRSI